MRPGRRISEAQPSPRPAEKHEPAAAGAAEDAAGGAQAAAESPGEASEGPSAPAPGLRTAHCGLRGYYVGPLRVWHISQIVLPYQHY